MYSENMSANYQPNTKADKTILFLALGLLIFGLIMIMSTSNIIGFKVYNDSYYFVKRHLFFMFVGAVFFLIAYNTPHKLWRNYSLHIWLVAIFMVLLTYIPHVGSIAGGSSRWISLLGFRFQPSDVLKFSLVLLLADLLDNNREQMKNYKRILPSLVIFAGLSIALVLKQPDLGTSIVLFGITFALLLVAGFPMGFLLILIPSAIFFVIANIIKNPYQLKRVLAFIDPWQDPLGKGFHVIQSLIAVATGGLFGLGLGQSRQKFFYLPQQYTDFIFSIIAEEFGFIFTSVFIIVYLLFIARSFIVAIRTPDLYSKLLCVGITCWIAFQFIINVSVTINLMPTKGITLPFISFGGTSLVMVMFAVGVVCNISRYRNTTE